MLELVQMPSSTHSVKRNGQNNPISHCLQQINITSVVSGSHCFLQGGCSSWLGGKIGIKKSDWAGGAGVKHLFAHFIQANQKNPIKTHITQPQLKKLEMFLRITLFLHWHQFLFLSFYQAVESFKLKKWRLFQLSNCMWSLNQGNTEQECLFKMFPILMAQTGQLNNSVFLH